MNDIEEYKNTIELLKQALLFYAGDDNYKPVNNNGKITYIDLDHGSQARYALDLIEKLKSIKDDMQYDYQANVDLLTRDIDGEEIVNLMKNLVNKK